MMNTLSTSKGGQVLAYVHGQLSDAERLEAEQALFGEEEVAEAFAEVQGLDRMLRECVSVERSQEGLVDMLLALFDEEEAVVKGAVERGWLLRSVRWVPLAAALMFLLVGVQFLIPQPSLRWTTLSYVVPQYRGAHAGTDALLSGWYAGFQEQVSTAYEGAVDDVGRWRLEVSVAELSQAEYRVDVQAVSLGKGGVRRQWVFFVADLQDLEGGCSGWAEQVAEDLVVLRRGL